jgi:UDP-N-acetylmuramyl pentapeptide synthase
MGIDGPAPPKNMGYLLTIIKPQIGILINESPAHVANYESLFSEKGHSLESIVTFMTEDDGKLLKTPQLATAITNGDDPYISIFTKTLPKHLVRTVGTDPKDDCTLSHHSVNLEGTTIEFSIHSFQEHESTTLFFPAVALPREAAVALGASIVAALSLGIPLSTITTNLQTNFHLPPSRASMIAGLNESQILDSSYNASSASVLSFLELLKSLSTQTKRPSVFVMGDMKELGSFSQYEHSLVAKAIPDSVDHLVLVGKLTRDLMLPIVIKHQKKFKTLVHFSTSREAGTYIKNHLPKRAIILFKGSQLLEEAIKFILKSPDDSMLLCRQDQFWKSAKKRNGTWVEI